MVQLQLLWTALQLLAPSEAMLHDVQAIQYSAYPAQADVVTKDLVSHPHLGCNIHHHKLQFVAPAPSQQPGALPQEGAQHLP